MLNLLVKWECVELHGTHEGDMGQLVAEQLLINEYIYLSRGNFLNFKGHMKVTRNSWLFNSYKFMLNLLVKWELVELHGTHEGDMGQLVVEQLLPLHNPQASQGL